MGFGITLALLRKDLRIASRSRAVLGFMLLFALLCVVVFAFGFLEEGQAAAAEVPGVLWVTLLFTGTVGLLRLFAAEEEGGTLQLATRTAAGPTPLLFSKALLQLLFCGLTLVLVLPIVLVFFDGGFAQPLTALAALALGLIGQSLLGALVAALLVQVRLREVLLPLVLYPLLAPLLIAGVRLTALAQTGALPEAERGWLQLMAGYDLLVLAAAPWLHARAVE